MKSGRFVRITVAAALATSAVAVYGQVGMPADEPAPTASVVDAAGNMRVPDAYRTTYEFLGSWAIAGDPGQGSKEIHTVYASPGTVNAYRREGRLPNGTVLVKEVYQAVTKSLTTGSVSRADTLKGWFVMVKGRADRYPANKLWGDGWGWSWFDAPNPSKTTSTDYRTDCRACHVPAHTSDWVYVDGYPPLKPMSPASQDPGRQ